MSGCIHLDEVRDVTPRTPEGGEECLQTKVCGQVGCRDDSPNTHATKHVYQNHLPIIQSFEPGEEWGWCYTYDLLLEPAPLPEVL